MRKRRSSLDGRRLMFFARNSPQLDETPDSGSGESGFDPWRATGIKNPATTYVEAGLSRVRSVSFSGSFATLRFVFVFLAARQEEVNGFEIARGQQLFEDGR